MPSPGGQRGRPFRDHRQVVEGIIFRFRTGSPKKIYFLISGIDRRCGNSTASSAVTERGTNQPTLDVLRAPADELVLDPDGRGPQDESLRHPNAQVRKYASTR